MPRESTAAKTSRVKKILAGLRKTYPDAHCELDHVNPLELLIATILSAQCTDKRVNLVTKELFKKYRSAADYANASLAELEQAIKTTGFFRNKAKNIQACCRKLVERHGGQVPRTMEELTQLDGVGRKTANVVLGNAFGINVGVVVDTHVTRLSHRLGLTKQKDPEKIEQELMALVPPTQWTLFSHWLIWHGRRRCAARKPDCGDCEIKKSCPRTGVKSAKKTSNIEHRTSNLPGERETSFGAQSSMFDVRCSPPPQTWLLLDSGSGNPAFNMALDEALLEAMSQLGRPVLRFYGWTEPAATFGYFQKYAEVERATLLRPLIRRPTGGGIVPHDADWTYSLAFPPGHEWHSLKAEESYRRVHEWIQAGFAKLKVATELAPGCKKSIPCFRSSRREGAPSKSKVRSPKSETDQSLLTSAATSVLPGQCFAGYEKFDVLWNGRKIAGAAQRRNKLGLLVQGSVQPPPISLPRMDWQEAMCAVGNGGFGTGWLEFEPDDTLRKRAEYLVRHKYSRMEFIRKR